MKKIAFILFLFLGQIKTQSQELSNLFSQNQADLKYLAKQLALLQVYIGDVENGYQAAKEGLTLIGEIKHDEFNLHSAFFNSLKTVNPEIKKYARVAEIISLQIAIAHDFEAATSVQHLSPSEMSYISSVSNSMMTECAKSLQMLTDLITDDTYQMDDAERIKRINSLYLDMQEKYAFTETFTGKAGELSAGRDEMGSELNLLENLE